MEDLRQNPPQDDGRTEAEQIFVSLWRNWRNGAVDAFTHSRKYKGYWYSALHLDVDYFLAPLSEQPHYIRLDEIRDRVLAPGDIRRYNQELLHDSRYIQAGYK